MRNDTIHVDCGALTTATNEGTYTGTMQGRGRKFVLTKIGTESECKVKMSMGGDHLTQQPDGLTVRGPEGGGGILTLPVPVEFTGGDYRIEVYALAAFTADDGRLDFYGYWKD